MLKSSAVFDDPGDFHGRATLVSEIERFAAASRRQLWVAAVAVGISLVAGVLFLTTRIPLYTTSTLVLIDNRHVRSVESVYDASAPDLAASVVDSQVEMVRSAEVTEAVIRKLGLMNDPRYTEKWQPNLFEQVKSAIFERGWPENGGGSSKGSEELLKMRRAVERVEYNLEVHRLGRTMVLQISYSSPSPSEAATIANAYAEAYLADQLNSKYEATKRASQWLEERLTALKEKALSADLAIQKFREDHGLILSGGKLINEQQLSEINTQLVTARAERARAEARFERIEEILKAHETRALVSEAIGNVIIEQLRSKYLDVSKREFELETKVGPEHQSVIGLKAEMSQYEQQMFAELGRLAEAYRSEVNIDRAKEASLAENLAKVVDVSAKENKSLVDLRELEREAEAYRNLYQSYMQRYQESLQQQSFPIIEARIITSAYPPLKPSSPKKLPILIMFAFLGAAAGAAVGAFREFREKGFLREDQIRNEVKVECLGLIPLIPAEGSVWAQRKKRYKDGVLATLRFGLYGHKSGLPAVTKEATPVQQPLKMGVSSPNVGHTKIPGGIEPRSGIMSFALDNPGSAFTETLMAVKLAADIKLSGTTSKVIGIVSALPSEGKSVLAKNFASILAMLNAKTLLIDADIRGPELTRRLAPSANAGLIQAVIAGEKLEELVLREERSGLHFLPSVSTARVPHTSELLASPGMRSLLGEAQQSYDYIIIDLPPFGPVADVRAISPQIQAFAYVTEWRKTPRKIARDLLESNEDVKRKCLGIILNKVDIKRIELFEDRGSRYYYFKSYRKNYYLENA